MYNLINLTNATNLGQYFKETIIIVDKGAGITEPMGLLYILIMGLVFLFGIYIFNNKIDNVGVLLMTNSFISIFLSILGWLMGVIPVYVIIFPFIIFFGSLVLCFFIS